MKNKSIYSIRTFILLIVLFSQNMFAQQNIKGTHDVEPSVKKEVYALLDAYLDAFNNHDAKAHFATYHFPHYRLASGKMTVLDHYNLADSTRFMKGLLQSDWHLSKWDHRNIIQASENKIHVDTRFTRYRPDGSIIASYESLYILTKEDGRWGIKMRSSFAE